MVTGMIELDGETIGYEAREDSAATRPGILVFHEIVGVVDYLKGVTRNLAENGYLGLAVDLYEGKTAKGFEDGRFLREKVTDEVFKAKTEAGLRHLKSNPYCTGRIGVLGFCLGGGLALTAACLFPEDIHACSVFYGKIENPELLKNLRAPVWGNFGGEDPRITDWVLKEFQPAMKKLGKQFDFKVYPGAKHAFHNPTIPAWHHPEAAKDAWLQTLEFFSRRLRV